MENEEKIKIGISIGDLNGIGPEIILKSFEDARMLEFYTPVVFASSHLMHFFRKHFGINAKIYETQSAQKLSKGKINVVNVWKEQVNVDFGAEDPKIGEYAFKSLEAATEALNKGDVDVLVTAPIHKHNIQSEKFKFPGHTDYLAEKLGGDSLMFMVADSLRVGLLTDHVPVKDVPKHIDADLIKKKIDTLTTSLKQDFAIEKPKIAVLGINPHVGDNGVIGDDDDVKLKPVIKELQEADNLIFGPYSADSFFGSHNYKNFDAVLASYHDQGLIPFKTITFGAGVNFTAGLKKVRTSPDHGTAFEIAGKGEADESSFKQAIFTAVKIFRHRRNYLKYAQNPLEKTSK
ncbi:4-hydroxythreonine-4-phosphate dehydrogenase PdxA [Winogradskyella sp. A3E31]|uniref:4-hydroxythreonine-4-phosphate dehydrogenase PdxA n=1 Tax=Winogradskyella sp. A3E31 TaxID=3349637 RepID=UPI00398AC1BB